MQGVHKTYERSELQQEYLRAVQMRNEYLRRAIVDFNRIDLLATEVMGFDFEEFHRNLAHHQLVNKSSALFAARGTGKSTIRTILFSVFYLCCDPNTRICIASSSLKQSKDRLSEIAKHLTQNQLLIDLFGQFIHPERTWNKDEIEIAQRTMIDATASIVCISSSNSTVGKHFDVLLFDDYVDGRNSGTELMRDNLQEFTDNTVMPMLDPPGSKPCKFTGQKHAVGTRFHYDDLYGRWMKKDEANREQGLPRRFNYKVIPIYDLETGTSCIPSRFSVKQILEIKSSTPTAAFGAQYMCNTEAMKGALFQEADMQDFDIDELPRLVKAGMKFYMGVDLAISQKQKADDFAIVVIGLLRLKERKVGQKPYHYYIVDDFSGKVPFTRQAATIKQMEDKWKCEKIVIEKVAYQDALIQQFRSMYPTIRNKVRARNVISGHDKTARAHLREPLFRQKRMFFPYQKFYKTEPSRAEKGKEVVVVDKLVQLSEKLRHQLMFMPKADRDDLFDAMDHALWGAIPRGRQQRDRSGARVG